jgi:hypothetical protein
MQNSGGIPAAKTVLGEEPGLLGAFEGAAEEVHRQTGLLLKPQFQSVHGTQEEGMVGGLTAAEAEARVGEGG